MSKQINWRRARLSTKPSLDFRREFEFEDYTAKWLAKAESRQRERRGHVTNSTTRASRSWVTQQHSSGPVVKQTMTVVSRKMPVE